MCFQKCSLFFQINRADVWSWRVSSVSQPDMHHVPIPVGSTEPGFVLVSADLALCWTGFGNLISKLPSPNYCKNSGRDGEGVSPDPVGRCCAFLLPGPMFIIGPVLLLGTGVVGFLKILLVTSSLGEQGHEMF